MPLQTRQAIRPSRDRQPIPCKRAFEIRRCAMPNALASTVRTGLPDGDVQHLSRHDAPYDTHHTCRCVVFALPLAPRLEIDACGLDVMVVRALGKPAQVHRGAASALWAGNVALHR